MLTITKDTLRQLNAVAGCLDDDTGDIFVGFVGRLDMADRLYHGVITLRPVGDELPTETVSIKAILDNTEDISDGDSQD
jgi:hypothetical protein